MTAGNAAESGDAAMEGSEVASETSEEGSGRVSTAVMVVLGTGRIGAEGRDEGAVHADNTRMDSSFASNSQRIHHKNNKLSGTTKCSGLREGCLPLRSEGPPV